MRRLLAALLLASCAAGEVAPDAGTICDEPAVSAACERAADHWNECCGSGLIITAPRACRVYDQAGYDPGPSCQELADTSCGEIHLATLLVGFCCCPVGYACDLRTPTAECAQNPAER